MSEADRTTLPLDEATEGVAIGPYRLLRKIGEGGMGEVWLAQQQQPVRRRVAIKVIKLGMDTREVVARFELERQAIAVMEHPGIARMFDAGVTKEGRPFFVMEYVAGDPLHTYCDRVRLSLEQRLQLFLLLCHAVQHAHQKAIIHRDLKPSNVLVVENSGRAEPKIIDFGIAKAIAGQMSQQIVATQYGSAVGTPEYMSPEQAEGAVEDIDTRTDVYSLGVILYELLTGCHPLNVDTVKNLDEMRRRIRAVDPVAPSICIRQSPQAVAIAQARAATSSQLMQQLNGDLNAITLKALEKDRNRRYSSPVDMAADIERHLRHEPVLAHPPSVRYRIGRFTRRHRFGVIAGATATAMLIAFSAAMALLAAELARERDRVAHEAETRQRVVTFLKELFESADPAQARGAVVTARELLDRGAQRIQEVPESQAAMRAELMETMGNAYEGIGIYADAERLLRNALAIRERTEDRNSRTTLNAAGNLGFVLGLMGRDDEAVSLISPLLSNPPPPQEHDDVWIRAQHSLGASYLRLRRYVEAEPLLDGVVKAERQAHGAAPDTWIALNNLAILYSDTGRVSNAIELEEEVLEGRQRALGQTHPLTLMSMNNLAADYQIHGRLDDARALLSKALTGSEPVLGSSHPSVGTMLHTLGEVEMSADRYAQAVDFLTRARAVYRKQPSSPYLPLLAYQMAQTLAQLDRASEALSELREAIATGYKPKPPPESDPLLNSLVGMPGFADAVRGVSQK